MPKQMPPFKRIRVAETRTVPKPAEVVAAITARQPRPFSHEDLLRHFQIAAEDEKSFKKMMKSLVRAGFLDRIKGKRYLLPVELPSPAGADAPAAEGQPVLSPAIRLAKALEAQDDEDEEESSELSVKENKQGGEVPQGSGDTSAANREPIRAKLIRQGHLIFAVPVQDPASGPRQKGLRAQSDKILIPKPNLGKAKVGDLVMVQLLRGAKTHQDAMGKVLSGLRREATFGEVAHQFFRDHALTKGYPRKALQEIEAFGEPVFDDKHGREDLRGLTIVTIDPITARDHDDAISLEKLPNGHWKLGVHIADVAEYVPEDSALDKEALQRSFTQYLPWTAMPMLPEKLSADLCSLREGCERLAFSCFMDIDAKGQLGKYRFAETFIRVTKFHSYEEAQGLKDRGDPALTLLDEFAALRLAVRKSDGNLEFSFPEPRIKCDDEGVPVEVYPGERLASHGWIEECMLLCNQAAAKYLTSNKLPGLFRVHEQPDLEVVADLFATQGGPKPDPALLQTFRELKETKGYLNPAVQQFYARLLSQEGGALPASVQRKILMSMKKALYAPEALGHFALGWLHYAHFTSPIRRYADLWIHRVMKAHVRGQKQFRSEKARAVAIAEQISEKEIAIMKTERKGLKTATAWILQKYIGEEFTATITGVEEFGLFVSIQNPYGEGMVPVARLGEDFFTKDDATYSLVGKRTKTRFSLGQTMAVRLTRCNPFSGQVDFEPTVRVAGVPGAEVKDSRDFRKSKGSAVRPEPGKKVKPRSKNKGKPRR